MTLLTYAEYAEACRPLREAIVRDLAEMERLDLQLGEAVEYRWSEAHPWQRGAFCRWVYAGRAEVQDADGRCHWASLGDIRRPGEAT